MFTPEGGGEHERGILLSLWGVQSQRQRIDCWLSMHSWTKHLIRVCHCLATGEIFTCTYTLVHMNGRYSRSQGEEGVASKERGGSVNLMKSRGKINFVLADQTCLLAVYDLSSKMSGVCSPSLGDWCTVFKIILQSSFRMHREHWIPPSHPPRSYLWSDAW